MLHCRDDLAETLRAVHRIACIRRRLRRSLFRLCGRHANWKRPPDALQLPARCPAAARSLLRTRSAAVSTPPTRLLHPLCTVAIQRTLIRVVEIFSIALFLYIISTTVHSYTNCPLCPRPPLQYPLPSPTRLRGAPASSCSCAVPDRVEGAGPDAEPEGGEAREPPLYTVTAGRTRLGLLRRVHRQRPRIVHRLGLGTPHPECCWAAHLPSTSEASRLRTWSSTYDVAANFAGSTEKSHCTHGTPEAAPHVW